MALDEKLVTEALGKLKEVIVKIMEERVTFLNDSEFQKLFSDNAELVDKAQLTDEELDELIKILRKNNPAVDKDRFQEAMKELEGKHLGRLRELNALTEEAIKKQKEEEKGIKKLIGKAAQDAAGIVDQVVEEDMQTKEYDEQKKKSKILYYYVWWLLDSEEDYQTLVSNPHNYPRDRGTLKVHYKELGNKNIDEALAGVKHSGKVAGEFLGALGLIGKNEYFENIVPRVNLKPGQLIALGAARAKRWDWRTREIRGLNNDRLGRADPERFIWKWNRFNPSDEGKGTIKGRVIEPEDFEAHKNDINYLMNPANDIGIAEADAWAESGGKNLVGTKKADENGFFTLEGIPLNIAVTVKAKLDGSEYNPGEHKIPNAPIVLSAEKRVQEGVIVPLKPKTSPGEPEFHIKLYNYDAGHNEPLNPPFGNKEAFEINKVNKDFRSFKVTKNKGSRKVANAWYYFYAQKMRGLELDEHNKDAAVPDKAMIPIEGQITRRKGDKAISFKFGKLHHRVFRYGAVEETLEVTFSLPTASDNGKYRIWCLLLKSEAIDLRNCLDFNYFEFYVGPVHKGEKKEIEWRLEKIDENTKKFIREWEGGASKWHKEKDAEKLQDILNKIQEFEKKYPQFFQNEMVKKRYFDAVEALSITVNAWESGNMNGLDEDKLRADYLKPLMKEIVWIEETIKHLNENPFSPTP